MRPAVVVVLSIAALGSGFVAGMAAQRRAPSPGTLEAGGATATGGPGERARTGVSDELRSDRDRARAREGIDGHGRAAAAMPGAPTPSAPAPEHDGREATDEGGDGIEPAAPPPELVSAAESCDELLGQPIAPRPDAPSRHSGPALSRAVSQAIEQAGVPADVEGVDCSEFPCIVFGRLAGDEEDVEEIERSAALDPYEADVLTLLLWATTVDEAARTHPTAKETGLFALAYYDVDDRAELGDALDRRIRARVLEVWNAERPGPPGGPAL